MDDDHEKVRRSIETFLGGAEASAADTSEAAGGRAEATTVAVVALVGLPDESAERGPSIADAELELATVERTIRGAARATDDVTTREPGRYQVILAATGELAARAYLRRVRATVEPTLIASGLSLRLAIATATVLDEPIDRAIELAERRLDIAIAADVDTGQDRTEQPRASGD